MQGRVAKEDDIGIQVGPEGEPKLLTELRVRGDDLPEVLVHLVFQDGDEPRLLGEYVVQRGDLDGDGEELSRSNAGHVRERVAAFRVMDVRPLLVEEGFQEALVPVEFRNDLGGVPGHDPPEDRLRLGVPGGGGVQVDLEVLGGNGVELLPLREELPSGVREAEAVLPIPGDHAVLQQGLDSLVQERVLRDVAILALLRIVLDVEPEDLAQGVEGDPAVQVEYAADGLVEDRQGQRLGAVRGETGHEEFPVVGDGSDIEFGLLLLVAEKLADADIIHGGAGRCN